MLLVVLSFAIGPKGFNLNCSHLKLL